MPSVNQSLSNISAIDKRFVGTVAFRNEKITLPDGSKVAIGIDGEIWVIVYQHAPKTPFIVYEYNAAKGTIIVDKVPGRHEDMAKMKVIIDYFFGNAQVDDLVTIEPKEER